MEFELTAREPFDLAGIFEWLAARAIPGVERAGANSYARTLMMASGPAWFEVSRAGRCGVRVRAEIAGVGAAGSAGVAADFGRIKTYARRLFDLDADSTAIDDALAEHAELAELVARRPGIRVAGAVDPNELLIRVMIGQQISVAAARTMITRLVDALGQHINFGVVGLNRMFPTMGEITQHGAEILRGPRARISAIIGAARALDSGELALSHDDDRGQQRARLIAMPGIGSWTADYVGMRVLNDPDVFLAGDSAVRAGAMRAGLPGEARALTAWAQRARPWRSYLTTHLWAAQ